MNNKYNLSPWQRFLAYWGTPNDNGGSNYTDDELRYYLKGVLDKYNDFIPTPVVRDAYRGARIRYAQPMSGGTNYPVAEQFDDMLRDAIDARIALQNAPSGTRTPTGATASEIWGAPLTPRDAILKQALIGEQQGAGKEDYYPPME